MDLCVIVLDDLGWLDVDPVLTPNLLSAASQGATLRRFYTTPVCSQTRYCLHLGEQGRSGGILTTLNPWGDPATHSLPFLKPGLAPTMKAKGYTTALVGKWHLGTNQQGQPRELTPWLHGFDYWRAGVLSNLNDLSSGSSGNYQDWYRVDSSLGAYSASQTTTYATRAQKDEFLAGWAMIQGPKYAHVAFSAPHGPWHVPPAEDMPPGFTPPNTGTRGLYERMVAAVDLAVGEMLATIDLENTVVWIVSDNGTASQVVPPGVDPDKFKTSNYEGGICCPAWVLAPGVPAGLEVHELVHASDVMATSLGLLGAPVAGFPDSMDLAPVLKGSRLVGRNHALLEAHVGGGVGLTQAVVEERWKLRKVTDPLGVVTAEELYDLATDPFEEDPLPLVGPDYERLAGAL